jgi:hypothetical protein
LKNRLRKILKYEWKKINIKTTFKSILENIFQKNINFGKLFLKNYEGKIGISRVLDSWKKYGGRREKLMDLAGNIGSNRDVLEF